MARHAKSVVLRQAHQRDLRTFTIQEVVDLPSQSGKLEAPQPYQRTRGIATDRACKQGTQQDWPCFQNRWSVTPWAPAVAHVIAVHMERCTLARCSHHSNCSHKGDVPFIGYGQSHLNIQKICCPNKLLHNENKMEKKCMNSC